MRHRHSSRITAMGAATLLLLASCGSPDEDQGPSPAADSATQPAPEDTTDTETSDSASSDPASSDSEPSDPETSAPLENQGDDGAASGDFSTEAQESDGFPGEFTRGEEPNHLVEIRSGVHEGYDRVVFEFAGDGVPSWRGEYTDAAAELGRGEPIDLAGEHILEINVNGPSWAPGDEPEDELATQEYYERDRGGAFEEIFIQGPFEAHSQYLIGVDQQRPFQVQLLEEPTRLVVDLQTDR